MALKEKLERLHRPDHPAEAAASVREWQEAVRQLYVNVEHWLDGYIRQGLMRPERVPLEREEEDLGTYLVDRLDIELGGGKTLVFLPIGRIVLDARGRVDMYVQGEMAEGYMLLRDPRVNALAALASDGASVVPQPSAANGGWALRRNHPRNALLLYAMRDQIGHLVPLNSSSLEAAIDSLLA
jgi:hypothetical protein